MAVLCDERAILELVLKMEPSVDANMLDDNGATPLHYACKMKDYDAVKLLLAVRKREGDRNWDFDLELRTFGGETPLFVAVRERSILIVRQLLWN